MLLAVLEASGTTAAEPQMLEIAVLPSFAITSTTEIWLLGSRTDVECE
jgi:hypothetical protein